MEFAIEKCATLVMKSCKRHVTDRMELPNQDKFRKLEEKETYKYVSILEAGTIKQVKMNKTERPGQRIEKTMEYEGDNYTNCDWCFWHGN